MTQVPTLRAAARTCLALLGAVALACGPQQSEAPGPVPAPPETSDPPTRAGRLALIEGAVSFRPAAGDTWQLALPNAVVTTADRLWVDTVGRAEVEVGQNAIRLSRETELDVIRLSNDALQLRVPQGTIDVRVKVFGTGQDYELDAPNSAVALNEEGEYRLDVSPDGATTKVTVWSGQADVTAAGSSFPVKAGQVATINGDVAPTYDLADTGGGNAFDRWARSRDAREDRAGASARYASADMGGLEDLDDYGAWEADPDFGPVWYPAGLAVGWVPYGFGFWGWDDPWGWMWMDDDPWGWAPFHYGRWAFIGARWGWCPGAYLYSPIFAPGLVAFMGGPEWGYFGAGGGLGWFPLGPGEPYFPPYHNGIAYRERINATNIPHGMDMRNPSSVPYRNRSVAGAVTAVPERAFVNGDPVEHASVHVPADALASARLLGSAPSVVPTSASLAGRVATPGRSAAAPPAGLARRQAVALHAQPPAPVPFSAEAQALRANGGRPLTPSELSALRASNPAIHARAFPMHSAAARLADGRGLTPARPGLPATTPALSSRRPVSLQGRSRLEQSYLNERDQLEARHMQEFAHPPRGESIERMRERQDFEHRELQSRYGEAFRSGMDHMPPPVRMGGGMGGRRR